MASISSAGNITIPVAQPARRQAERSVSATETELTVKKEQQVERADDNQGRGTSDQIREKAENTSPSSVAQADDEKSAGEQQKIEAAQQEAQRAEFNQQAGNVRDTEPDDVRPPSSNDDTQAEDNKSQSVEIIQEENPAIDIFNQTQNVNAQSRQGQAVNQFA
jgi:hypothetical protein